jgi:glycerol uptake facilitator-like aquaporin
MAVACAAEGLVLMGLVFSIGQVSGSHYNPATSLAFALRFAFEWWRLLYYLPAQFIGIQSFLVRACVRAIALIDAVCPHLLPQERCWRAWW